MSNNKVKKWVGIFLLAIVMLLGFTLDVNFNSDSNVYAADGCGTLRYKSGGKCVNGSHTEPAGGKNRKCKSGWGKPDSNEPNCSQKCSSDEHTVGNYCKKKPSTNSGSNNSGNSSTPSTSSSSSTPSSNNTSVDSNNNSENVPSEVPDVDIDVEDPEASGDSSQTIDVEEFGFTVDFNSDDPESVLITSGDDAFNKKIRIAVVDYDEKEYERVKKAKSKINACTKKGVNTDTCAEAYTALYYVNHASQYNGTVTNFTPSKHETYPLKITNNGEFAIFFVYSWKNKKGLHIKAYGTQYNGESLSEGKLLDSLAKEKSTKTTTADFSSGSSCDWAVKTYYKYAGNHDWDKFTDALVNKTMGTCFPKDGSGNLTVKVNGDKVTGYDSGSVEYNISEKYLDKIKLDMEAFEKTYEDYLKEVEKMKAFGVTDVNNPKLPELTDKKWIKVSSTKLADNKYTSESGESLNTSKRDDMLTCDAKLTNEKTYKYLYYEKSDKLEANMLLFNQNNQITSKKTVPQNVCEYSCREQVVVALDPPTAVFPGDCFTYRVEIKSTTMCVVKPNFDKIPDFRKYENTSCQKTPVCGGGKPNIHNASAGPDEEFDSCVADCDAGKYTNSCVNKCFNKVYGGKSSNTSNDSAIKTSDDLVLNPNVNMLTNNSKNESKTINSNNALKLKGSSNDACTLPTSTPTPDYIKSVYNYVNSHVQGSGDATGSGCYWTQYAKYYFSNLKMTAMTVCTDEHYKTSWLYGTTSCASNVSYEECKAMGWSRCFKGRYGNGDSYYPNTKADALNKGVGFRRNRSCKWVCKWVNDGGSSVCYDTTDQIENQFEQDLASFTGKVGECVKISNDCKDESVTYTMSANDDIEKEKTKQTCDTSNYQSNDLCRKFPSDKGQEQSKLTYVDVTDTDSTKWVTGGNKYPSVVELNAGSCANQIKDKNYDWTGTPTLTLETKYHSIITFPGAWIGNKHGDVVYDNSKIEEKWYQKVTGKYCTPLTAEPVNTDYWTKYQLARYGCTDGVKEIKNTTNYVYNILSDIKNFGNFEWTFNTGCFYGVNKKANVVVPSDYTCPSPSPCKPGEACPPTTCVGDKCDSTKNCNGSTTTSECDTSYGNFDVRSNANSDMFPSKTSNTGKGGTVSTSTKTYKSGNKVKAEKIADNDTISSASTTIGRTPGFNWTVNASNLSVAGYPVTPTLLIQKVQDSQYNAYSNDELDYEFYISKNNIKNIRDLKGKDAKFNNFGNSKYKDNYDTILDNHEYRKIYADAGYKDSDIPTVTFYYSGFIRDTAFVSASSDDGKYTSKYASEQSRKCNNMKGSAVGASGGCDDLIAYYSTDGNQLKNFIDGAAADLTK